MRTLLQSTLLSESYWHSCFNGTTGEFANDHDTWLCRPVCHLTPAPFDIEITSFGKIEEAWKRVIKSDVKYCFVLDLKTLKS